MFSKELADHFESIQKLVVLSHLKPRHRALGKATETVEEGWNKKSPIDLSAMDTGKYQNKPSRQIKTFPKKKTSKGNPKTLQKSETDTKQKVCSTATVDMSSKPPPPRPPPPPYNSPEMIQDMAEKRFAEDSRFANTSLNLTTSPYLNEVYTDLVVKSLSKNYLEQFKSDHTGIQNLGFTCWFNAIVQLFANSIFMQDVEEKCKTDLVFVENLRNLLTVFRRAALGIEIRQQHIQEALEDLKSQCRLQIDRQNDAHEFVSTAISDFLSVNGNLNLIKVTIYILVLLHFWCGESLTLIYF